MLYLSGQYFWKTAKLHGCFLSRFSKFVKNLQWIQLDWNGITEFCGMIYQENHCTSILLIFISPVSLNLVRTRRKERWKDEKLKEWKEPTKENFGKDSFLFVNIRNRNLYLFFFYSLVKSWHESTENRYFVT